MNPKDIHFEWDEDKNKGNFFKHGIDFWDAVYIWNDPHMQERYDIKNSNPEEDRWQAIGLSRFGVLFVVYTDKVHLDKNNIRIISARKATSYEKKQYQAMTFAMNG
jgi:uncharacterized DUF497 family protein